MKLKNLFPVLVEKCSFSCNRSTRLFLSVVMIAMFASPFGAWAQGNDPGNGSAVTLYGDVNEDGDVNILDVTLINKYLLGTAELSEQGKKNADVDANGTIDTTDSLNILKCCLELIEQSEFPIK